MNEISREMEVRLIKGLQGGKVCILLGPRRSGKTKLMRKLMHVLPGKTLYLNGEDQSVSDQLTRRTKMNYTPLLAGLDLLMIDEAHQIPEIGMTLKFIVDEFPSVQILITSSSSFQMTSQTGEPLVGRSKHFLLLPLSERELIPTYSTILDYRAALEQRITFGHYPEVHALSAKQDKIDYLQELLHSYLIKDILTFETVKNSRKIFDLLRLLALQSGSEVSMHELGKQLSMSKNTIERYVDLLEKVFVIYRLGGYSQNLRKEVTKSSKFYFFDLGIRNALIGNFQPMNSRNDWGMLWENFLAMERVKQQHAFGQYTVNYFWRTYDQQEVDWVEWADGSLRAFEFKWTEPKKVRIPTAWQNAYPEATYQIVHSANYEEWLS